MAAAAIFACFIGGAAAQQIGLPSATGAGPSKDQLDLAKALVAKTEAQFAGKSAPAASGAINVVNGHTTTAGPNGSFTRHATYCSWYSSGSNQYFYIFPQEGGYIYWINNLYSSTIASNARVQGNYFIYYTDSSGSIYQTVSYPFK
jgi:hypothetical protein